MTDTAISPATTPTGSTERPRSIVIGIAGGSGSGKSTMAHGVAEALRPTTSVAIVDMDAYYHHLAHLTLQERRRVNWDHPDAVDTVLLADHLERLLAGMEIDMPIYDFAQHLRRPESARVTPADVIVLEGILLFADERVRGLCDVKVFVEADADVRLIRRIRRDIARRGRPLEEILTQYLSSVQPMYQQFVEPSKRYADVIVPGGGHDTAAVEMIVARIQRRQPRHS